MNKVFAAALLYLFVFSAFSTEPDQRDHLEILPVCVDGECSMEGIEQFLQDNPEQELFIVALPMHPEHGLNEAAPQTDEEWAVREWVSDALLFAWARFPNRQEIVSDSFYLAPVEVLAHPIFQRIGNAPSTKAFLRDALKILPVIDKARNRVPVGGTKYRYDWANVYSQIAKSAGKAGVMGLLVARGWDPKTVSTPGNVFGEHLARYFITAGKTYQDLNSTESIHRFVAQFREDWAIQCVAEATPKVLASKGTEIAGDWITAWFFADPKLTLVNAIQDGVAGRINGILPTSFAVDVGLNVFANSARAAGPNPSLLRYVGTFSAMFALRTAVATCTNMVVTTVLAPTTRMATDLAGEYVSPAIKLGYTRYFRGPFIHVMAAMDRYFKTHQDPVKEDL